MSEPLTKDKIIEKLAELEHQQWEQWSKSLTNTLLNPVDELLMESAKEHPEIKKARQLVSKKLNLWMKYWGDYSILEEPIKNADREWARKAYAVFEEEKASAVRLLREKIEDPKIIAQWGKTQQERIAIGAYVKIVVKSKIDEVFGRCEK